MHRVVNGVEYVAVALAAITVLMLFRSPPPNPAGTSFGAQVFGANCAVCHGPVGQGDIGPDLTSGNLLDRFDSREEMIAFIRSGSGEMPAFGDRLSAGEIGAVVDHVRNALARQGQ